MGGEENHRERPQILHITGPGLVRSELRKALEAEGYAYFQAPAGSAALDSGDVILLEQGGTWSVADYLRRATGHAGDGSGPRIIVLGTDDEADELVALTLGAHDFLPRNTGVRRIVARVKAALRRGETPPDGPEEIIASGPLRMDLGRYETLVNSQPVSLTASEFKLLHAVVAAEGRVTNRAQLMSAVFGIGEHVESRRIDVHMVGLRKKLGTAAGWLQTVRSLGYVWRNPRIADSHLGSSRAHAEN